jgi:hypothetical protein
MQHFFQTNVFDTEKKDIIRLHDPVCLLSKNSQRDRLASFDGVGAVVLCLLSCFRGQPFCSRMISNVVVIFPKTLCVNAHVRRGRPK